MRSVLVKDTTREERERIVAEALSGCGEGSCDFCGSCSLGAGDQYKAFEPYIMGECEIREVNALLAARHGSGSERG